MKLKNVITLKILSTKDIEGPTPNFWEWLFTFNPTHQVADYVETVNESDGDCIRWQIATKDLLRYAQDDSDLLDHNSWLTNREKVSELLQTLLKNKIDQITYAP